MADPAPAGQSMSHTEIQIPMSTAARTFPGLLVDPSWLRDRMGGSDLHVVDMREEDAFSSGRVPGAVHLDLPLLGTTVGGCECVLVDADTFGSLMAERGISNGDAVLAYDDQWGLAAARLVWALHRYGHTEVAALDGGWDRWVEEGGEVEGGEESVAPGRFEAIARPDVFADTAWIAGRLDADGPVLVDTRSTTEFDGGHLPGAISWDWFNAVPPGSWDVSRDPTELRVEWGSLGLDPSDEVVVYCGSGMRAAHTYLTLRNAGFDHVRLYDGSWQEWSMKMAKGTDGATGGSDDD